VERLRPVPAGLDMHVTRNVPERGDRLSVQTVPRSGTMKVRAILLTLVLSTAVLYPACRKGGKEANSTAAARAQDDVSGTAEVGSRRPSADLLEKSAQPLRQAEPSAGSRTPRRSGATVKGGVRSWRVPEAASQQAAGSPPAAEPDTAPASALPGGAVFDKNLSVSAVRIERGKDSTRVRLAFRRLGQSWPQSVRAFRLRLWDDRENAYETYFHVGPGRGVYDPKGRPPDYEVMPPGFTWVCSFDVRVPLAAPIARAEIEREFWSWRDQGRRPGKTARPLDISSPTTPKLDMEFPASEVLRPGDAVNLTRDVSIIAGETSVKGKFLWEAGPHYRWGFNISVPLTFKNADYNERHAPAMCLVVQLSDGTLVIGGSARKNVPGKSQLRIEARGLVPFEVLAGADDRPPPVPRALFLHSSGPIGGRKFFRVIALGESQKQAIEDLSGACLVLRRAETSLANWREGGLPSRVRVEFVDYAVVGSSVWAAGYRQGYGGYGRLVCSTDAGRTWRTIWRSDARRAEARQVDFFDEREGLLTTTKTILRTRDGGLTWTPVLTVRGGIEFLIIKSKNCLVVPSRVGANLETSDGGRTWERIVYHGRHYGSRDVKSRSSDGGRTWVPISSQ